MAEIRKLSPELIGKIAAGEVVERPASVVKELVENAIDAEATHITVELRGGGIEYIRITDNGKGIPASQIRLAFERHATSKLRREEELYCIHTLGFRGEALASVAAVAKVTCTSKTQEAEFGVRCRVEGGEFADIRQAASPAGTTFVVEELFYNTPVRRRFLKKPAAEAGLVADYMLRLILSHPEIAFRFVSQGKTVYHSMGDGKLESALFCLYGKESFRQMLPVKGAQGGTALSGYIGVGELARGNRQQQSFFINGRFFRSALLSRALESGCEGRVMIGKFPMCALFLETPYQNVDVNVHPNKLEVRFQDENAVALAVRQLCYDALHQETLGERLRTAGLASAPEKPEEEFSVVSLPQTETPASVVSIQPSVETKVSPTIPMEEKREEERKTRNEAAPERKQEEGLRPVTVALPERSAFSAMRASYAPMPTVGAFLRRESESIAPKEEPLLRETPSAAAFVQPQKEKAPEGAQAEQTSLLHEEEQETELRFVGVVFDTYWIFESGDRLLWVDQHAAHERILYDRFMKRFDGEQISQQLLSPQLVQLSAGDMSLTEEIRPFLEASGFQLEPFDERSVALHAVPTLFGENSDPKELFLEALDQWQNDRGEATREKMRAQVAQMACKHAIKGGDRLNRTQMEGFLREMLRSSSMPSCPHGRPIVIETARYALEKRFKRIQS